MTYFFYLKRWFLFLLYSLFSIKNPFNFWGVVVVGGTCFIYLTSRGEGFNDFRWNPTGELRGQENTILKGTSKMYGPFSIFNSVPFLLKFIFLFNKMHGLLDFIIPFKIKIIEKSHTVLFPDL